MEIHCGPDGGETGLAGKPPPPDDGDTGANLVTPLDRPARIEDGDLAEAVSSAVMREIQGGSFPLPIIGVILKLTLPSF